MQEVDPNDQRLFEIAQRFLDVYRRETVSRGSLLEIMKTDEGRKHMSEINRIASQEFESQTHEEMKSENLPYVIGIAVGEAILFALDQAEDSR